jgi:hypothetical protein
LADEGVDRRIDFRIRVPAGADDKQLHVGRDVVHRLAGSRIGKMPPPLRLRHIVTAVEIQHEAVAQRGAPHRRGVHHELSESVGHMARTCPQPNGAAGNSTRGVIHVQVANDRRQIACRVFAGGVRDPNQA